MLFGKKQKDVEIGPIDTPFSVGAIGMVAIGSQSFKVENFDFFLYNFFKQILNILLTFFFFIEKNFFHIFFTTVNFHLTSYKRCVEKVLTSLFIILIENQFHFLV